MQERYDGYLQLENGVGMLRLLLDEFDEALQEIPSADRNSMERGITKERTISVATGRLAYPYVKQMVQKLEKRVDGLHVLVYEITNYFFGELITVSGLLTGQDIREQLLGKKLGEKLLLPQNVLRSGETVFLDDMTVAELEKALQVPVDIVKSSGRDLVECILG